MKNTHESDLFCPRLPSVGNPMSGVTAIQPSRAERWHGEKLPRTRRSDCPSLLLCPSSMPCVVFSKSCTLTRWVTLVAHHGKRSLCGRALGPPPCHCIHVHLHHRSRRTAAILSASSSAVLLATSRRPSCHLRTRSNSNSIRGMPVCSGGNNLPRGMAMPSERQPR
jgi:hypothetical protein